MDEDTKRRHEVHFPYNFVQYDPCGHLTFPVTKLCHATHKEAAEKIKDDNNYRFKSNRKNGKSYRQKRQPLGKSYCSIVDHAPDKGMPCYKNIPETDQVFPDYYSWWGLTVDEGLRPSWIKLETLPPYLKTPPISVYGSHVFESNFCDLLRSYASSRRCGDIYLKMGGTLRYKCEVAYVVIVCTSHDLEQLDSYKSITCAPPDVFDPNGLTDDKGKVINTARIPYFTAKHVNSYFCYETLNFAFYFPEESYLTCPSTTVQTKTIAHNFCITAILKEEGWSCPDKA